MARAYTFTLFFILLASVTAHPLSRTNDIQSRPTESRTGLETRTFWEYFIRVEARGDQHPMEAPSVPPEDIIHQQGPGVYPCSGKPVNATAKNCSTITKELHTGEYGFIPDGGFKLCMKPRSVKPVHINGTCFSNPTKDEKKSEYLDENEKLKVDDDLIS
ncbi:hypothetical protein BDZ94DRAFT_1008795 [Collybia nuda]|uniref:Uncharacterized protein n=1 Tax=Collybia nuda TaxID=64659 RepID=A0A9P6CG21_9AGAR|nr:hypothetical protein BDZ94DRAFT_1008795 [Collybia nuda]